MCAAESSHCCQWKGQHYKFSGMHVCLVHPKRECTERGKLTASFVSQSIRVASACACLVLRKAATRLSSATRQRCCHQR